MFDPTKISILTKSCIINGNSQTCDKIKICFQASIKPEKSGSSIGKNHWSCFYFKDQTFHAMWRYVVLFNVTKHLEKPIHNKLEYPLKAAQSYHNSIDFPLFDKINQSPSRNMKRVGTILTGFHRFIYFQKNYFV